MKFEDISLEEIRSLVRKYKLNKVIKSYNKMSKDRLIKDIRKHLTVSNQIRHIRGGDFEDDDNKRMSPSEFVTFRNKYIVPNAVRGFKPSTPQVQADYDRYMYTIKNPITEKPVWIGDETINSDADYNKWLDFYNKADIVSDYEFDNFRKTHDLNTYVPSTEQEKYIYQKMIEKQHYETLKENLDDFQHSKFHNAYPKFADEWDKTAEDSFNHIVQTITTADELYSDKGNLLPWIPWDKSKGLLNWVKHPEDEMFYWEPDVYGTDDAISKMKEEVPPPREKDWTDYFIQGLTMPFNIGHDLGIPGIPDISTVTDLIGSGLKRRAKKKTKRL